MTNESKNVYNKNYYKNNKDYFKEYHKNYYIINKEKTQEQKRKRFKENEKAREKRNTYQRCLYHKKKIENSNIEKKEQTEKRVRKKQMYSKERFAKIAPFSTKEDWLSSGGLIHIEAFSYITNTPIKNIIYKGREIGLNIVDKVPLEMLNYYDVVKEV